MLLVPAWILLTQLYFKASSQSLDNTIAPPACIEPNTGSLEPGETLGLLPIMLHVCTITWYPCMRCSSCSKHSYGIHYRMHTSTCRHWCWVQLQQRWRCKLADLPYCWNTACRTWDRNIPHLCPLSPPALWRRYVSTDWEPWAFIFTVKVTDNWVLHCSCHNKIVQNGVKYK